MRQFRFFSATGALFVCISLPLNAQQTTAPGQLAPVKIFKSEIPEHLMEKRPTRENPAVPPTHIFRTGPLSSTNENQSSRPTAPTPPSPPRSKPPAQGNSSNGIFRNGQPQVTTPTPPPIASTPVQDAPSNRGPIFARNPGRNTEPSPVSVPPSTYESSEPSLMNPPAIFEPATPVEPPIAIDPTMPPDPAVALESTEVPETEMLEPSNLPELEPQNTNTGLKAFFRKVGSSQSSRSQGSRNQSNQQNIGTPLVTSTTIYAMSEGKQIKLPAGTQVRFLREGTYRSMILLSDGREASIENGTLSLPMELPSE